VKVRSFPLRHRLISFLRDLDIRGIRRLSVVLPKIFLPKPSDVGQHILNTPDGIKLIIDPVNDHGVELSLFETGTYEKGILDYIRKHFNEEGVFVDVGANIGLMSLFVSRYFPQASIHAFEAHPDTVAILKKNLLLNTFSGKISVYPYALGAVRSKVVISADTDANRGGASIVRQGTNAHEVDCFPLDEVLKETRIDLLKIDVEGYELPVLEGAKQLIEAFQPTLILEISRDRDGADQTQSIWNFIRERSYRVFILSGTKERKSALNEIDSIDELPDHDNIICIRT
jgi:FkbM family methyltransferase